MVGTHFHHCHFMFRSEAKQCLGHTNMVIEITLGKPHVVFLFQYGRYEFLGGCLAVCAGHADDGGTKCLPVFVGKCLECLENVWNEDETVFLACVGVDVLIVDNCVCAARLQCLDCVLIAIECLAPECEEDGIVRAITAVSRDDWMLLEYFV